MAKATAICTCAKCGKDYTVTKICYNRAEADRWEIWAKDHYNECPDCHKAQKQAERDEENRIAAEKAAALPTLTGSEKQVSWANTIRQKALDELTSDGTDNEEYMNYIRWLLNTKTSATWWIDRRNHGGMMILRETVNEYRNK